MNDSPKNKTRPRARGLGRLRVGRAFWAAPLIVLALVVGCGSDQSSPLAPTSAYLDVTPLEALELTEQDADLYIIDVSTDYPSGFIPRAVNYSLEEGVFEVVAPRLNADRPYLIYSHDDETSRIAAQMLIDLGFREVYRLDGNFLAWVSAGLPVTRPSG